VISATHIRTVIDAYLGRYPDEAERLAPLTEALGSAEILASRKTLPGHVTCSGLVLDPHARVLHIRHNILNTWLCPGGHLEPGDATLTAAALREVVEETGISAGELTLLDDVPIDIDVHSIPANPAKGEPDHQHFDVRYVFVVAGIPEVRVQAEEVHAFAWLPAAELEPASLALRVADIAATRHEAGGRTS